MDDKIIRIYRSMIGISVCVHRMGSAALAAAVSYIGKANRISHEGQ